MKRQPKGSVGPVLWWVVKRYHTRMVAEKNGENVRDAGEFFANHTEMDTRNTPKAVAAIMPM